MCESRELTVTPEIHMSFRRFVAVALLAVASISIAACTSPTGPSGQHSDGTYEGSGN